MNELAKMIAVFLLILIAMIVYHIVGIIIYNRRYFKYRFRRRRISYNVLKDIRQVTKEM